ncbi:11836_t:CDS:2, partial [Diversispora eburnea]
RSVQWYQVFQNWIQQKRNIIELYTHLDKRAMFRTLGCTNITLYNNNISYDEFWTNATNSEKDRETITNLYMEGFLKISLRDSLNKSVDTSYVFWNCFRNSYNANPKGINGKICMLSIIGEDFTYKEIIEKLE